MPEPSRVLVMAPNWLGDAVMALPAIFDIRRAFPAAVLAVAARPAVAGIFRLARGVEEVIALEWQGGLRRRRERARDVARLAGRGFDVAILLPNAFAAAWLTSRAGIAERWGYATDLRGPWLTRRLPRPRGSVHQAAYYQHLVAQTGLATGPLEPALDVPPEGRRAARALLASMGWDGSRPLVVAAPGAAYGTAKRWPPRHFAALVSALATSRGATVAMVGSAGDAETTALVGEQVPPAARPHVLDLAGRTSLEELTGVLAVARACVSNDSGVMHLAAAVGVPVAALFGPTREHETAPLPRPGGRVEVLVNPVWCRPCMLRECPIDHRCMEGLLPARVLEALIRLLEEAP